MEQSGGNEYERLRQEEALGEIGFNALHTVIDKYGDGLPSELAYAHVVGTERDMPYHNMQHSLRVRNMAARIAQKIELSNYDIEFVRTIASAHDIYHGHKDVVSDEHLSANWLVNELKKAGFADEEQEIAYLAILGTTPVIEDGVLVGQQLLSLGFPSERAGDIAVCVAAADLESLFAPHGPRVAHDLFRERRGCSLYEEPSNFEGFAAFQKIQLQLMENFTSLYPPIEQMTGDLRKEIYLHQHTLLEDFMHGKITTWEQVMDRDAAFERLYSE